MKMLIGGKLVDASNKETIDVVNPATMQVVDTVPSATKEDIDLALDNAVKGFKEWSEYPIFERINILRRFKKLYLEHGEEIAQLLCEDGGKTISLSRACVDWTSDLIDFYIEQSRTVCGETMPEGSYAGHDHDFVITTRQPLGVVVTIIPFNYPNDQISHKVIPALVMGNSVVVKPATDTPRANILYCQLLLEAGVPANAIQIVTGRGSVVGNLLVDDPRVAKVALTGSTQAGIKVAKMCAEHMHHTCLELGGNDPYIVLADADPKKAAIEAADGRISNSGQTCCAPKRFIVHNSIKEQFIHELIEYIKTQKVGDPLDESSVTGPLVSADAAKEVEEQINYTISQGAKLLHGGKRYNESYMEITVLDVTKDMDIMKDMEVFGPVFPVVGYDTVDEAIEIANSTMYGLSSGVYGNNVQDLLKISKKLEAGTVMIGGHANYRTPDQPFGGWKMSGMGREGSTETLKQMSQLKATIFKKLY